LFARKLILLLSLLPGILPAIAQEVTVAAASDLSLAMKEMVAGFEQQTGVRVRLVFGSSAGLYAQIRNGAPFDVFLAADDETPPRLESEGFAVAGSRFTYATGGIVLYSPDDKLVRGEATLKEGRFVKLAIANPATAPYGAAAVQAMRALGLYETLEPKLVQGNNIAQAYQFVASRNAELGFVALSQVAVGSQGSRWTVPETLYEPIAQDAVLLERGAGSEAARAFLAFLRGPQARAVKQKYGYGPGD